MSRYRRTELKTWNDAKFRRLSPIPPCGQGLWIWFLTGPRTSQIPGVIVGSMAVLAAELKWDTQSFELCFSEIMREGMAHADWEAGLVWLPNATRYNPPASINAIKSWEDTWHEIPECELKDTVFSHLKTITEGISQSFLDAFIETIGHPGTRTRTGSGARTGAESGSGDLTINGSLEGGAGGNISPAAPIDAKTAAEHDALGSFDGYSPGFGMAWECYPDGKRASKVAAMKAWKEAIRLLLPRLGTIAKADDWLCERVRQFSKSALAKSQFCPGVVKWISEGRYDDAPAVWNNRDDDGEAPNTNYKPLKPRKAKVAK